MEFTSYWNWLKMLNKQIRDNWNTVVFQFVVKCSVEKYWIGEGEGMPRMTQLLKNIYLFTSWVLFQHEGSSVFITAFKLLAVACDLVPYCWIAQLCLILFTRLPCPSLSPRVCSNSCSLSWWCHPTISSSVPSFFSCPQSFPTSESFPMSQLWWSKYWTLSFSISPSNEYSGISPGSLHWECRVLVTGLPGKSWGFSSKYSGQEVPPWNCGFEESGMTWGRK